MKPSGTITKYYPFIDEESKSILKSLINESNSYNEFVQQLCELVIENDVPVNLAYLAAVQAWWCRKDDLKDLIQEKFSKVPCIRPWAYPHNSVERDQITYHDAVVEAIDRAIDTNVEDWIETELHLLHTFYHWPIGEISSALEPIEKAKGLIAANPSLSCFEPLICAFEGLAMAREGDIEKGLEILHKGEQLVERYDDVLFNDMLLLTHADILIFFMMDVQGAMAIFESLYKMVQELDLPYFICEVLHDSTHAFEAAGEYDLAISSIHEIIDSGRQLRLAESNFTILSRNYANLGNGPKALEWINRGFDYCDQFKSPFMLLSKAWALALVNRFDEADQTLEDAYSLIMKTGLERHLGDYYHISGVVEYRKGELFAALDLFEKAWEIAERDPQATNQNRALLELARVEIEISKQSKTDGEIIVPGNWLSKLEKHATDFDLPGIRMQAALLKSEFYQNQGQLTDARTTLEEALNFTDSLGVRTLRRKIIAKIQSIDDLL